MQNEMLWVSKQYRVEIFTNAINKASPIRSEDDAGDDDKSSN